MFIFNQFLAQCILLLPPGESKACLQAFADRMDGLPKAQMMVELAMVAPHFMVSKPWDKRLRKVEIGLRPPLVDMLLVDMMPVLRKEKSFRPLLGQAPRGEMEQMPGSRMLRCDTQASGRAPSLFSDESPSLQ